MALPIRSSGSLAATLLAFAASGCMDYWFGDGPGPVASLTTPSDTVSGDWAFAYTLSGPGGTTNISVSYSTDGSTFLAATEGPGSDGTRNLAVGRGGVAHRFVWASGVDLPAARLSSVRLRIAPEDGEAAVTSPFRVRNGKYLAAVEKVPSGSASTVRLYSLDASGGQVSFLQSLLAGGSGAYDVVYVRNVFYVANETSNSISALQILEDSRILMPVAGSPFAAGISGPRYLATDGSRLFASGTGDAVALLERDASTGGLRFRASVAVRDPRGLAIWSSYLYVASEATASIHIFYVASDGTLLPIRSSPVAAGGSNQPRSLIVAGLRLYAASASSAEISGFNVLADGGLAPLGASPFPLSVPAFEKLALSGSTLFGVSGASGQLVVTAIDDFGDLAEDSASPIALGGPSYCVAASHGILVVGTTTSRSFEVFTVSGASLTPAAGSPYAAGAEILRAALSD